MYMKIIHCNSEGVQLIMFFLSILTRYFHNELKPVQMKSMHEEINIIIQQKY